MMRYRMAFKWAVYAVGVLLLAVIQGDPHMLPRITDLSPLLMIPCVTAVSMVEGEKAGVAYAVFGGLLWDIGSGAIFGFNAFFLLFMGIAASLLVQFLFRNTVVSSLIFCAGFTFLHEFFTWFFFVYLRGTVNFGAAFLQVILPTVAYTLIFAAPLYYLVRFVSRRFTPA